MCEKSFYEEALELLKNRPQIFHISDLNRSESRTVPAAEHLNENDATAGCLKPCLSGADNSKLPPLLPGKSSDDELTREESNVSARLSSMASKSSTVFPKIDSRYLPK